MTFFKKFDINGRTALVTGGSRGIGFACADGLMQSGCDVGIFDVLDPSFNVKEYAKKYNIHLEFYKTDVTDIQQLERSFNRFKKDFDGRLDICVPCAGVNKNLGFLDTQVSDFDHLCGVNFKGAYFTSQFAAKQMIKNKTSKGSIVFICSMGSYIAIKSQRSSAYCGTKGGIRSMVAPIACELQKYGIRTNSLSPGYVKTEMTTSFPHLMEEWKNETMNHVIAEPEDIQGACIFLASDASSYICGEDILVDAGVTKW